MPTMTCPRVGCGHTWAPRTAHPIRCPRFTNILEPPRPTQRRGRFGFKIGGVPIGDDHPPILVLEAGATHQGFEDARELIRQTPPAHSIKFQILRADDVVAIDQSWSFRNKDGPATDSLWALLRKRELEDSQWEELAAYARSLDVRGFATAFSPQTVDFLAANGACAIKIAGGDMTYLDLISYAASSKLPIMLDTRGLVSEVSKAVEACVKAGNEQIMVVHCPSGYPTDESFLEVVALYRRLFPYPVGFSDHSTSTRDCIRAVVVGASMIEKCVSSDPDNPGIEHVMSISPSGVSGLKDEIEASWRDSRKKGANFGYWVDIPRLSSARRSLVLTRDLPTGAMVEASDMTAKRPGTGIAPSEAGLVVGKALSRRVQANVPLQFEDFDLEAKA